MPFFNAPSRKQCNRHGAGWALCLAALPVFAFVIPGSGIWGPILMLGGLIFVHELGHFLAAKLMGMPADVFSIGFGPRLFGFNWRETDVRLSLLPIGGYVRLAGYNPEEPGADDPHGFLLQPARKKLLFYSGGIIANVLASALLIYAINTERQRYPAPSVILQVQEGSAAEEGGLKTGDELLRLGDLALPEAKWNEELVPYIQGNPGLPLVAAVVRDGEEIELAVTPRLQGKVGFLGISPSLRPSKIPSRPLQFQDFVRAVPSSLQETALLGGLIANAFWKLISFQSSIKELGGPIAIAKMGSDAAKAGWEVYCFMTAFISMNLAILNALPIPFLDGGHMSLIAFEKIRRKDLSIATKEKILTAGFYFMAAIMVFVIFMDLWRLGK
jgi:regulator of sigma E protease